MNIVCTLDQFNTDYIYYREPISNTVIDDSNFVKIIYSSNDIMINGIYINFKLKNINIENYFKKIKINYDLKLNEEVLNKIYDIELEILKKYNKKKNYKRNLYENLSNGYIKIFPKNLDDPNKDNLNNDFNSQNNSFILKISGLWDSATEYALTYKIYKI